MKKLYCSTIVALAALGVLIACNEPAARAPSVNVNSDDIKAPQMNGPSVNLDVEKGGNAKTDAGAARQ